MCRLKLKGPKQNMEKLPVSKFSHLSPKSLTPLIVINLYFRISLRIFVKIRNGSNRVFTPFRARGETNIWKKPETENLMSFCSALKTDIG
jgi:hypothetical protein